MATLDDLVNAIQNWAKDNTRPPVKSWPALLGNQQGEVDVEGLPDFVYARMPDSSVVRVYNKAVPPALDLPVIVGYDDYNPDLFQVLSQRAAYGAQPAPAYPVNTGAHADTHRLDSVDPLWIEGNALQECLVRATSSPSWQVVIPEIYLPVGGVLQVRVVAQVSADLSTHKPTVPGDARWVSIALDNTGSLVYTIGGLFQYLYEPDPYSYFPGLPAGLWPVGDVLIRTEDVSIRDENIDGRRRFYFGGKVVENASLALMPALTIKGNDSGIAATPQDLTTAEVASMLGIGAGVPTGTGTAGRVTQWTGTSVIGNGTYPLTPEASGAPLARDASGRTVADPLNGNARGVHAVDLQTIRGAPTQVASGYASAVTGGRDNTTNGFFSAVAGGEGNVANGFASAVAGGQSNTASGNDSVVAGGEGNTASGNYSLAAGRQAKAIHDGAMVLTDDQGADYNSAGAQTLNLRFASGIYLNGAQIFTGSSTLVADSVTNTQLANMAAFTLKGNATNATADPADLTRAQVHTLLGTWGAAVQGRASLPGTVGTWDFGSVQRSTGNVYDVSQQGRTVTNANVTYNTAGGIPYGVFNGSTARLTRTAETDIQIIGNEAIYASARRGFVAMAWVRYTAAGTRRTFCQEDVNGAISAWSIGLDSGNYTATIFNNAGTPNNRRATGTAVTLNVWVFKAIVFTPGVSVALWVNGTKTTNSTTPFSTVNAATCPLGIGARDNSGSINIPFQGDIALASLHANALTDAEIDAVFQRERAFFGV